MTFTHEDLFEELKSLKPKQSSGVNLVNNRMLREGSYQLAWPLSSLFNWCMEVGEIPKEASIIKIKPIPKKASDMTAPSSWRGIALSCVALKTMEGLFIKKLEEHLKEKNIFADNQYAFTQKRGIRDKLLKQFEWTTCQ